MPVATTKRQCGRNSLQPDIVHRVMIVQISFPVIAQLTLHKKRLKFTLQTFWTLYCGKLLWPHLVTFMSQDFITTNSHTATRMNSLNASTHRFKLENPRERSRIALFRTFTLQNFWHQGRRDGADDVSGLFALATFKCRRNVSVHGLMRYFYTLCMVINHSWTA